MSSQVGSYYYTAKAGEQLYTSGTSKTNQNSSSADTAMPDYTSTVSQTAVLSQSQNQAVYYNALASFALNNSNAVNQLNAYNTKTELDEKLSLSTY